ncbi:MAG: cell division protein FtsH, partial [Elusimicrobia bacterium]|nr:cell division protein FtsH [Elusimicrobiota bacterium]
ADGERPNVGRAQSQRRQNLIEQEVQRILDEQHARVRTLLTENRPVLDRLSQALREKETLREADLDALLPPRPAKTR